MCSGGRACRSSQRGQLPLREQQARWAQAENDCCLVYYLTGSAAERDLAHLLEVIDDQADGASEKLGVAITEPVEVLLLPRVLGHGGFANGGLAISYLDRNYIGGDVETIIHHEFIHILDARLGGELKPSLLQEGFAVYQSGGHFKPEPLMERAAALLDPEPGCVPASAWAETPRYSKKTAAPSDSTSEACGLGLYIPLADLLKAFYQKQHEIGYLEGGALIEYMAETWSEKAFNEFYRDIHSKDGMLEGNPGEISNEAAVNSALRRHFGLDLDRLEKGFLNALQEVKLEPVWVNDVRLGLMLSDSARAYQQKYVPSAYYLHAWLPDRKIMREKGIVADILRSPTGEVNLALEAMLTSAKKGFLAGDFVQVEGLLQAVTSALTSSSNKEAGIFAHNPLAGEYYNLTAALVTRGLEPQWMWVYPSSAAVWASEGGADLIEIQFVRKGHDWIPINEEDE